MFSPDDTIVAIATPPGRGGIGVVRIGGPEASSIASSLLALRTTLEPRHATFTKLNRVDFSEGPGGKISPVQFRAAVTDEVVATYFAAPRSYTGQDIVEISAHGSPVVLNGIVIAAIAAGARLAQPGEFTLRAFLNGKRDLVQAEAVADLIDAATPLQARTAFDQLEGTLTARIGELDQELFDLIARLEASLDFPDEGFHFIEPREVAQGIERVIARLNDLLADSERGRMIREGATVVIAGRPNVGKSSLFNKLLGSDRAIVTSMAGTTRDLLAERVDIGGVPITLVDTAGSREDDVDVDPVEREGVERGARARTVASLVLLVLDAEDGIVEADRRLRDTLASTPHLVVANKSDTGGAIGAGEVDLRVSARSGVGLAELRERIASVLLGSGSLRDTAAISNIRHIVLLGEARDLLRHAAHAAGAETPEEFVLSDLQAARARFDEVVGRRTTDDVLAHIFEKFCIGK